MKRIPPPGIAQAGALPPKLILEHATGELESALKGIKLLALDCDGVLWAGERALPGAAEITAWANSEGISTVAITNNASRSRKRLAEKANRLEISLSADDFYSTNYLVGELMRERYCGRDVLVLGSDDLYDAVKSAGAVAERAYTSLDSLRESPLTGLKYDALVQGLSATLSYPGLCHAATALQNGATFIACNPDSTFPVEDGILWPGNGSFVELLSKVSGVVPEVLGKPAAHLLLLAMEERGARPDETLIVGDRPSTDIACGLSAGAWTCLVLTGVSEGVSNPDELDPAPHFTAENLFDLLGLLKRAREDELSLC